MLTGPINSEPARDPANVDASATLEPPVHLTWAIDSTVGDAIKQAEQDAAKLIGGINSRILHYQEFRSESL